jgi:hypothetical protein
LHTSPPENYYSIYGSFLLPGTSSIGLSGSGCG